MKHICGQIYSIKFSDFFMFEYYIFFRLLENTKIYAFHKKYIFKKALKVYKFVRNLTTNIFH